MRSQAHWAVAVFGVAAFSVGACTDAEKAEWNRTWGRPWFGSSSVGNTKEAWTIECNSYEGPDRRKTANGMATMLKKVDRLDPALVRVDHGDRGSRVFYGIYMLGYKESKVDAGSKLSGDVIIQLSDEIKRDQRFIKQLSLNGQYPFFSARAIQKPLPDVGSSEWDLRNAKGIYTLSVGVTYSTPTLHNYKEAAHQWVRDLRNRGHEAYYYHDPDKPQTSICVGTFGEDALPLDQLGRQGYSPAVKALQAKEDFKYNLENGHRIYRRAVNPDTNRRERIPNYSFLLKIPQRPELSEGK